MVRQIRPRQRERVMSIAGAVAIEQQWYCCHCSDAGTANRNLADQAFTVFWPRYWALDSKQVPVIRSLFGPYLFVQFSTDNLSWRTIHNTRGIRRLISLHAEYPLPVPIIALQPFIDAYGASGLLPYHPPIRRINKPHWRKLWDVDLLSATTV